MTGTIIAEGQLERVQYAKLCIIVYYRRPAIIFITILGWLVMFYIFLMATINISTSARGTVLIIAFVYAAYLLTRPYLIYLNARNYFGTSKHLQEKIHYEFSEEKIITQSDDYKGERGWDKFYKIVELKHFFLLYHDAKLMNIIPKSFFKSPDDVHKLRELIREKSHIKQKLRVS
ncbi:MAG: YcxB family protein [Bacteroidia bacterium]